MKKESLLSNEAIVVGNFAENYQIILKDEIQSHQWSKEYCTLHPALDYYCPYYFCTQFNLFYF